MKVILLQELKGKGGEGDVVEVAPGFANNYLFRQGIAQPATKGNLKQLEQRKHNIAKREAARVSDADALKVKLESAPIFVAAQVGDEGQLFGSVTSQMIAEAVAAQLEVEIDRRRVELGRPIKVAGEHEVVVSLYREAKATLKVLVGSEPAAEAEEAVEAVEAEAEVEVEEAAEEAAE